MKYFRMKCLPELLCFACFICVMLSGCTRNQPSYRTPATADEIASVAELTIASADEMVPLSTAYLKTAMNIDASSYTDVVAKRCEDISRDEYAVFLCASPEDADRLRNRLNDELGDIRQSWDERYFTEEKEKIDAARAKSFGCTVAYAVLTEGEITMFFRAIESSLSA